MSDMYSSSTSFEYLNDEENNSNGSNGQVNSSIINQYERPGDSNEDGNIDIQSLSNSVTSENDLWTFYEKDANRDSEEPNVSKSDRILRCLLKSDMKGLRKLGREKNGFISDSLRRLVWPRLAKAEIVESVPKPSREQLENLETYNVICKDVIRTCFYQEVDEITRESWQDQLRRLVARLMVKNPDFHYFQGYHEICLIFLMVLGEEMAFHTMNSVSRTHLRKFLTGRDERLFKEEAERQFDLIYLIIGEEEPKLREFLEAAEFYPSYLIAWILTWFAHNVKGYKNIVRLLDLFLVSDPLMPLYLSAAILLHKKDDILTLECSFEEVYYFINKIWEREEEISLEDLICNARSLMSKYSPEKLTELHASRVKQLSQRKQRSALSNILHVVRQSSSLRMLSIPMAVIIVAYIYQNYLTN